MNVLICRIRKQNEKFTVAAVFIEDLLDLSEEKLLDTGYTPDLKLYLTIKPGIQLHCLIG